MPRRRHRRSPRSRARQSCRWRIEISFREGIQWGTKEAGLAGATLTFADHDPGAVVEESLEPEEDTGDRPGDDDGEEPKDDRRKKDRKGGRDGDGQNQDA